MNLPAFMEGIAREIAVLLTFLILCFTKGQEATTTFGMCSVSLN